MFNSKEDEEKRRKGLELQYAGFYGQGKNILAPYIHNSDSPIAKSSTCIGVREFFLCMPPETIDELKCGDIEEKDGKAHVCTIPASGKPSLIHMNKKPINVEQPSPEPTKKPENEEYSTSDMPGWY